MINELGDSHIDIALTLSHYFRMCVIQAQQLYSNKICVIISIDFLYCYHSVITLFKAVD